MAYDVEQFMGELFRMNFSCSDEERGCLFLKVIGKTSITRGLLDLHNLRLIAVYNSLVPRLPDISKAERGLGLRL